MNRKERSRCTLEALRPAIPSPTTELSYQDPFELLVAVILSAQCTDKRVNEITPGLFEAFPDAPAMAEAAPEDIFPLIRSCSYPNNKSKHLAAMARALVDQHGGQVPDSVEALMTLPGVGRKTAQVIAATVLEIPALPVDTHVFRVACRIGLAVGAKTPEQVERQLKAVIPRSEWSEAHHLILLHGRYTCTARSPKCEACPVAQCCRYFEKLRRLPADRADLQHGRGKYFCGKCGRYFDEPKTRFMRRTGEQMACAFCNSIDVYHARSGKSTQRVPDFRV